MQASPRAAAARTQVNDSRRARAQDGLFESLDNGAVRIAALNRELQIIRQRIAQRGRTPGLFVYLDQMHSPHRASPYRVISDWSPPICRLRPAPRRRRAFPVWRNLAN